jgi:hypothetical protein
LLKEFGWKGMIGIMRTRLQIDYKKSPTFKARFVVNLKAKEHQLKRFLELTQFEKLRKERWEKPGFYFRFNTQIIPTFSVQIDNESNCKKCQKSLKSEDG